MPRPLPCPCKPRPCGTIQVTGVGTSRDKDTALDEALDDLRSRLSNEINAETKKFSCKATCLPAFEWTPTLDLKWSEEKFRDYILFTVIVNGTFTGSVSCKEFTRPEWESGKKPQN